MFDYKSPEFFTGYFEGSPDFHVIKPFELSLEKGEENLIVGAVEVLNTIHPLVLRVEIPITFPHSKLTFRTKSIAGYPHLIHTGKINHGDWFCLNTPFAETATEQLNQEVHRLKEWISHQMREDLPAIIEDPIVIDALRVANAYEWENPDEVKEFASNAILTFVGEGFNTPENFKNKMGHLASIRTPDNRVYAFLHRPGKSDYKLPYIIVNECPNDTYILEDFIRMRTFFKWDDEICHHLLSAPSYHSGKSLYSSISPKYNIEYTEAKALNIIDSIKDELDKPDSYLDSKQYPSTSLIDAYEKTKVKASHKQLLYYELENIRKQVIVDKGIKYVSDPRKSICDEEEYDEEQALIDQWVEHDQYVYDYFIVGFESEKK